MTSTVPQLIVNQQNTDETIRVWQQNNRRWLDFDDGLIQSEIILNHPEILPLPLNRAMLAGMIFEPAPKRVLLAGTGGGATARYFAHRFPDVKGDAVEKSATIAGIAKEYFDFPSVDTWQIIIENIVDYVQQCQQRYDLILIDIAVDQKTPEWLLERQFLQQCRSLLTASGQVVINLLVGDANEFMHHLSTLRAVFERRTVCLSMPNYRNTVILAFNHPPTFSVNDIAKRAEELGIEWEIEFKLFYQQMLNDNPSNSGIF